MHRSLLAGLVTVALLFSSALLSAVRAVDGPRAVPTPGPQPTTPPGIRPSDPAADPFAGPQPTSPPVANPGAPPATRVGWTTSRIHGSPEPPPPFVTERLWPELAFDQPVEMVVAPGEKMPYVVERKGRILRIPKRGDMHAVQHVLDGANDVKGMTALYGLAFHPNYEKNRLCYLCYITQPELPDGTRVSQFKMMYDTESWAAHIDFTSEKVLLTFKSGGHNGGSLKFGPDGYLYITTGDGTPPSPPDALDTGQDVSDLLSSVLRIDVDAAEGDRPYAVPEDNPFVDLEGARPEIWAYGFRNPWRMSFDRATGDLWLGDVGWQLWEMVYRVERGGNYGWSVKEGPQSARPGARYGPTPILPPTHAHPRAEAASVTGGFVYRGQRFPDLVGSYVYGDYVTGKVWALNFADGKVTGHRELTDTPYAIICFFEDHDGEIALLDYNAGTIHGLVPNDAVGNASAFPRKLSETGLFADVARLVAAPGVYEFAVNSPRWMDGLEGYRLVGVPGNATETTRLRYPEERVPKHEGDFPNDTILAKTIYVAGSSRRVETQILHMSGEDWLGNGGEWVGYTYLWNDEQTDAELVPAGGTEVDVRVRDKTIRWRVSSRTECYACHNPWAGYRLGFTIPQLNTVPDAHSVGTPNDQLGHLRAIGLVTLEEPKKPADRENWPPRFVDPHHTAEPLEARARSYLHANCAHCHRTGGGGTATIMLPYDVPLAETELLARRPTQGTFGIAKGELVAPGDPFGSVLLYRMSKLGHGRMPHVGSNEIDKQGVALVRDWIASLKRTEEQGPKATDEIASVLVDVHAIGTATTEEERVQLVEQMLGTTRGALALANGLRGSMQMPFAAHAVKVGRADERPEIRDLFEPFVPASERLKRLGNVVDTSALLAMNGDPRSGKRLFFEARGIACRNCHRIGDAGGQIGPDLTTIGKKLDREKLLASILEPSKSIEPKWLTYVLETKRGRLLTGLLVDRTDNHVVLRQPTDGKDVTVATEDVEQLVPSDRSLMPDLQFRDLTASQLADLLAFLESQK